MHLNLTHLLHLIEEMPAYRQLVEALQQLTGSTRVIVLDAAKPYLIAALYQSRRLPMLVVTAQPENCKKLYEQLLTWCNSTLVKLFPETDVLRIDLEPGGEPAEVINLTENPDDDWPIHLSMECMALSPRGSYLLVTAPHGNRYQDREIYVFPTRLPELRAAYPEQSFRDFRLQLTNKANLTVDEIWLFPSGG